MTDTNRPSDTTDIDPDGLRDAEFLQTQLVLNALEGKTIESASVESTRIAIVTTDGLTFYFYGFLGGKRTTHDD